MSFQDLEAALLLGNAGWRETPPWVHTSCFACHKPIAVGERVYCPNVHRPHAAYCAEKCGPKAEAAVARKTTGEAVSS